MLSPQETKRLMLNKALLAIEEKGIIIANDYRTWLKVGFSIACEMGADGEDYFHKISSKSGKYKYENTKKQYAACVKSVDSNKISIAYFFSKCKEKGIEIKLITPKIEDYTSVSTPQHEDKKIEASEYLKYKNIKFWDYKTSANGRKFLSLYSNSIDFLKVLERHGVRIIIYRGIRQLAVIKNMVIQKIETADMLRWVQNLLDENLEEFNNGKNLLSKNYIKNWLNKKRNDFFAEEILNQLPHLTITDEMVNDTPNTSHVFYKNIVVRVSKEKGFELLPYEKIKRLVFETDILQREIPLKDQADKKFSADIFRQFVNNVAGKENERQEYLKTLLGYALHKNYNEGQQQSVIFTDSRLGENEGRSGKGTLLQGIKHMYNNLNAEMNNNAFSMIDGKNFNSDDKFKFSNCSLSTRFIALEDIKKNYNVEQHFYEVENGFKIDRKGKDPFVIRAKMFITTNDTVKIQGGSSKGRFIEFDLADHYSNSYAPIDEFKKWFWGSSFTKEDWADYDYFMLECLYTYLCYAAEHNKIEPIKETQTLTLRKIKEQVGEELVDFLENKIKRHNTNEEGVQPNYEYNKKEIYAQFLSETKLKSEKYSQRYFTKQLRLYKALHTDYQEDKQDKNTGKYGQEKRSGGEDFIIFLKTKTQHY